jgi:hypothetical protein
MRSLLLRGTIFVVLVLAAGVVSAQLSRNYQLAIVTPADDGTVFDDNGDTFVQASIEPPLSQGDRVELLVDGFPVAAPGSSLEFELQGIGSGPHLLQARVLDATGNVAAISPSSNFQVGEPAGLAPTRAVPSSLVNPAVQ